MSCHYRCLSFRRKMRHLSRQHFGWARGGLVLSWLVLSDFVFALSCLALPCLALPYALSCLVLSCLALSVFVLSCPVLSCLVLPCLVLSCLVLPLSLPLPYASMQSDNHRCVLFRIVSVSVRCNVLFLSLLFSAVCCCNHRKAVISGS